MKSNSNVVSIIVSLAVIFAVVFVIGKAWRKSTS